MATITKTTFTVSSTDSTYSVPGDRSIDFIQRNYASDVPNIGNMEATETVVVEDGVTVRKISFKPRVGTKG